MSRLLHHHNDDHDLEQIMTQIKKTGDFQKIADILGKMSDPTRVRIFYILCHVEECVMDIAEMVQMSSPAVSHHLKVLKDCGMIVSRRDGKEVYYHVADNEQARLMHVMVEEVMATPCPDLHGAEHGCAVHAGGQSDLAKEVHDYLSANIDRHITIESLAKTFAVNPTTLKSIFKEAYGNSIAAHMKEHRMEKAAELLEHTDKPIADIAKAVGFQTQSKFTQAFKDVYRVLPKDYRAAKRKS